MIYDEKYFIVSHEHRAGSSEHRAGPLLNHSVLSNFPSIQFVPK